MDSAPRKKTSPQPFARPIDAGLAPRALDAQRMAPRSSRLPTAAALQVALVASFLVAGGLLAGCAAAADEGIAADVARRPAASAPRTTETAAVATTSTTAAPAVSAPIEPDPHPVKGKMMPVMPTVVSVKPAPPIVTPPRVTGLSAPTPTTVPHLLGGKPTSVLPTTGGSTGPGALGSKPCDPGVAPETY